MPRTKKLPPKPPLDCFLVVSSDTDQQQIMFDIVRARDSETAANIIYKLRPYVQVASAEQVEDLIGTLQASLVHGGDWKDNLEFLHRELMETR